MKSTQIYNEKLTLTYTYSNHVVTIGNYKIMLTGYWWCY